MDGTILDKKFGLSKKVKTLGTQVTNLQRDVDEVEEDVLDKTDRDNVAPEFSATASFYVGDLVYHNGTLYEFTANHDGDWDDGDVRATTLDQIITDLRANSGGAELKILKYTGTGTTSYTLDFGEGTPAEIVQIIPEPGESVITNNYEFLSSFAWGVPFTYGLWCNKNNNLPSGHGGFNINQITYSNNTCTITGPSASAAANYEGQKYAVYYLA